jgi:hypothetical protein
VERDDEHKPVMQGAAAARAIQFGRRLPLKTHDIVRQGERARPAAEQLMRGMGVGWGRLPARVSRVGFRLSSIIDKNIVVSAIYYPAHEL